MQAKRLWWRRFWIVAVTLDAAALLLVVYFYFAGYLSVARLGQGIFAFVGGIAFTYFFYRMIRPVTRSLNKPTKNNEAAANLTAESKQTSPGTLDRTIQDIAVSGRTVEEVKAQKQYWINQEGIIVEAERDGFVRGRLGIPSGLGLTAPKYFEVSYAPTQNGLSVHTEGWISVFDVSERSFSPNMLAMGNIPRQKGWQVINRLWTQLKELSK